MEFGQDPSRFWRLTYREIDAILGGVKRRLKREHNDRAWLAWHTAYLTAYAPSKSRKFPKLEKLLWKEPPKPQSIAEMRDVARRWQAALQRSAGHHSDATADNQRERDAEDDGHEPASKS